MADTDIVERLRAEIERQCGIGAGSFEICTDSGLWQVRADLDGVSIARAIRNLKSKDERG